MDKQEQVRPVLQPAAETPTSPETVAGTGATPAPGEEGGALPEPRPGLEAGLEDVLALLHERTGHDFRQYRRPTLLRRLERRLQLRRMPDLAAYRVLLERDQLEADALVNDFLISVTNFFRDREAFSVLDDAVLPQVFRDKGPDDQVRVWVTACATGEEAYSIGMLLAEQEARMAAAPTVQVFATDIDERAIAGARAGLYPAAIAEELERERLERHFIPADKGYKVRKGLRDRVLFAPHDLLHDPGFSRLDLITCRNFLIYLNEDMHRQVLEMFHFALRPGGFLFLGSAETADVAADLFVPVDPWHRIYRARAAVRTRRSVAGAIAGTVAAASPASLLAGSNERRDPERARRRDAPASFAEIHREKLLELLPASVLLNADNEILHACNQAGRFLRPSGGEPTRDALALALPELRHELRTTLFQARRGGRRAVSAPVRYRDGGAERVATIAALPFRDAAAGAELVLVQFDDVPAAAPLWMEAVVTAAPAPVAEGQPGAAGDDALRQTRHQLQQAIEQADLSGVELRGANRQLQATVDALRTHIETLETDREETQAINEELQAVNGELKLKIEATAKANDDLSNLIASTDIATLFLDRQLRIKRYTPRIAGIFNMIPADVGRPLAHLTHRLDYPELFEEIAGVFGNLQPIEREVKSSDGRGYIVRVHPYRTAEERIEGVVVTLFDISRRREAEAALRASEERFRVLAEASPALIWQVGDGGELRYLNGRFQDATGLAPDQLRAAGWQAVVHPEDSAEFLGALDAAREGRAPFQRRVRLTTAGGAWRWFESHALPWHAVGRDYRGHVGISIDVDDAVQAEDALKIADRRKDEFLAILAHELRNPLAPVSNALQLLRYSEGRGNMDRLLEMAERQVRQMVRLVDDLMEVTRIKRGKIDLRRAPATLAEILGTAIESCQPGLEQAGHQLVLHLPDETLMLDADKVRLTQVFVNLLNNAIKYTPGRGEIVLSAWRQGEQARVTVRDNGQGIPPDQLPRIFEMFAQPHGAGGRSESGLGIGLTMVRSLLEMHGGSVDAYSAGAGKGSEFVVCLPLLAQAAQEMPARPAAAPDAARPLAAHRVLIVDDNRDAADSLCHLLAARGAEVQAVYDGQAALDALDKLDSARPQSVVLDIGMPGMDGYQVARRIRAEPRYDGMRIIALTGWGQHADRMRSSASGFDHHLTKPADLGMLQALLTGSDS
jgi:two-component system CheB/CheR fusion protein